MYHEFKDKRGRLQMAINIPEPVKGDLVDRKKQPDDYVYTFLFSFGGDNYIPAWDGGPNSNSGWSLMCGASKDDVEALYAGELFLLEKVPVDGEIFSTYKRLFQEGNPQILKFRLSHTEDALKPSLRLERPPISLFNPMQYPNIYITKLEGDPRPFIVPGFKEKVAKLFAKRGVSI